MAAIYRQGGRLSGVAIKRGFTVLNISSFIFSITRLEMTVAISDIGMTMVTNSSLVNKISTFHIKTPSLFFSIKQELFLFCDKCLVVVAWLHILCRSCIYCYVEASLI